MDIQKKLEKLEGSLGWCLTRAYTPADDGCFYQMVSISNRLQVEVRCREHGVPHFHIEVKSYNAAVAIADCGLLAGHLPKKVHRVLCNWLNDEGREQLIDEWNETRPDNCPIGRIDN